MMLQRSDSVRLQSNLRPINLTPQHSAFPYNTCNPILLQSTTYRLVSSRIERDLQSRNDCSLKMTESEMTSKVLSHMQNQSLVPTAPQKVVSIDYCIQWCPNRLIHPHHTRVKMQS